MPKTIDDNVKEIIQDSLFDIENDRLFLPNIQLDRPTYVKVNKVLEEFGGKWNRKEKCHMFTEPNWLENISKALDNGQYVDKKQEYQFFETPRDLVLEMLKYANIKDNSIILEPSAGKCAIAKEIWNHYPNNKLYCIELNPDNRKYLNDYQFELIGDNFLNYEYNEHGINTIIANPPFSKQQDIEHVTNMINLLRCGDRIVTVMSNAITFRNNKKTREFKRLLDNCSDYDIIDLESGTFKQSGTMVNAVLVTITV